MHHPKGDGEPLKCFRKKRDKIRKRLEVYSGGQKGGRKTG